MTARAQPSRSLFVLGLVVLVIMVVVGGGCEAEPALYTALPTPSRLDFAAEASPILAARCGNYPCHGNPVRPFTLYAVTRRRLRAENAFTMTPLSADEIDANYSSTLGFIDSKRARDTTLLQKALGIGGIGGHKGGVIFEANSDPEIRAIIRWIEAIR